MATALARQAISALNREKPHSSITDWIEILTSDKYEEEAYDGIPEIVDSINLQVSGTVEASRAIRKKLKHGDTHHQLRAMVILKALVENCGAQFQTNFANDRLIEVLRHLAADPTTNSNVKKKLMIIFASWKRQFLDDPEMKLVSSLFDQCRPYTTPRSEDLSGGVHFQAKGLAVREGELEQAKLVKERAEKEERGPKCRAFNLQQEKPQVLNCIATASQCSSNLVNALMLANPQQARLEVTARVQECFAATKKVRKELIRYIHLIEDEELIGTLLVTNERIVQALDTYHKYIIKRDVSDTGLGFQPFKTILAVGEETPVSELTKLQEKQLAGVATAQKSLASNNVHPDLQELSFGAIGSDAARLPPPIRPSSPDSVEGDYERSGSLSDFSNYVSSDEENSRRMARQPSLDKGKATSSQGLYHDNYPGYRIAKYKSLLFDESDPFADPH